MRFLEGGGKGIGCLGWSLRKKRKKREGIMNPGASTDDAYAYAPMSML